MICSWRLGVEPTSGPAVMARPVSPWVKPVAAGVDVDVHGDGGLGLVAFRVVVELASGTRRLARA
jgi:hypothetical protein